MRFQTRQSVKFPAAILARMSRFVMVLHMHAQFAFRSEIPFVRANLALELFLLTLVMVSQIVQLQVVFSSEPFTTGRTRVGLFSRVRSHVEGKIVFGCETLQANFTLMRFVVYVFMIT